MSDDPKDKPHDEQQEKPNDKEEYQSGTSGTTGSNDDPVPKPH